MRATTYLGLIGGITVVFLAVLFKGGDFTIFTNHVALIVCLGGTIAATTVSSSKQTMVHAMSALSRLFITRTESSKHIGKQLVEFSRQARAKGFASLDSQIGSVSDPYLRKGMHLIADGVDAERIEALMRLESDILSEKRGAAERMFKLMGTYSPMFGLIGTLVGLIQMLKGLSDPRAIGQGMSVALMATFYGVLFAGLIYLPLAGKIKTLDDDERLLRDQMLAGLLAIRAGENPEYVRETLEVFAGEEINT